MRFAFPQYDRKTRDFRKCILDRLSDLQLAVAPKRAVQPSLIGPASRYQGLVSFGDAIHETQTIVRFDSSRCVQIYAIVRSAF
jgi:hypothetical protein